MPQRILHLDADFPEHLERTPNGGAIIPARLTTTGIVRYTQPDGSTVREYRSPEEVFDPESLASLGGIPVTLEHPGLVTRTNFRDHTRGHVANGSVVARNPFAEGNLWIQDDELLNDISGQRRTQLSPGYNCQLENTPGHTLEGEPYDVLQRKIRYNHVAVTVKGRQGPDVALRLDSEGEITDEPQTTREDSTPMKTILIDGVRYNLGGTEADQAALEAAIGRMNSRFDSESSGRAELQTKLLAATARAEKAEADLKRALRYDADDVDVLAKAKAILGDDYSAEGKTPAEVMKDCVAKVYPDTSLDGKGEDYIAGLFDAIEVDDSDADNVAADAADDPNMNPTGDAADDPNANPTGDAAEPAPADRQDSMRTVNFASTQLPGTGGNGRQAPANNPFDAMRAAAIARGRAPLRPQNG